MNSIEALHSRLEDLARVLKEDPDGLALLGLGSVGVELDRLDPWSDLDFFVLVRPGTKPRFLQDPSWLDKAHPVVYRFKNTEDGFKLLFADGIFGEMAVFEPQELPGIPFAEGRVIWHREGFDPQGLRPQNHTGHAWTPPSADYVLGELLTCLYVGLCRWNRGERLSAWRFIQGYCLDRVLELAEFREVPAPGYKDPYNRDRRFEQRYPTWTPVVESLLQGIQKAPQSAVFLVEWADQTFGINQALKKEILNLAASGQA